MQPAIAQRLIDLNRRFYQSFAEPFSETRGRLQPGILQVLTRLKGDETILDLGCGNGTLASELAHRKHEGSYLGLDFSAELLEIAREKELDALKYEFLHAEITDPELGQHAALNGIHFDIVFCFATLHHIPSRDLRLQTLKSVRSLLAPQGKFFHSHWQFLKSDRLRGRIQSWELVDLHAEDVDEGDYLLDWRREGFGLRYVHLFTKAELAQLATASDFETLEIFSSDGETGELGLYLLWQ